ncbi:MAG TPA: LuxR C-terminal-related transcriptional regulator [Mariprofundaceae bacterium]|nr:LuxR C-terminal-related transcriptional regulator [Mariprofundaceae bacterium]
MSRLKRIESFSLRNSHLLANRFSHLILIYEEISDLEKLLKRRIATLQQIGTSPEAREAGTTTGNLTPKERNLLNLFAKGFSYQESADYLDCKLSTVQTHAKKIYRKLGVHSRAEAVHEALLVGLLKP